MSDKYAGTVADISVKPENSSFSKDSIYMSQKPVVVKL